MADADAQAKTEGDTTDGPQKTEETPKETPKDTQEESPKEAAKETPKEESGKEPHTKDEGAQKSSVIEIKDDVEDLPPVTVDMSKAPKGVYLYTATKREKYRNMKSSLISLDGLLDYDIEDEGESTFEISLFAENLHDILVRDFGNQVYESVCHYAKEVRKREKEKKREGEKGKGRTGT